MSHAARRRHAIRWCRYRNRYRPAALTGTSGAAKAILLGYREGWWMYVRDQRKPDE